MSPIESNLQHVRADIDAVIAGLPLARRKAVALVAVSKTKSVADIRAAHAAGQRAFGENYVQEGVGKINALDDLKGSGIEWHFIGPLQSNKARLVAEHFDWVHGVDRIRIAESLARHRSGAPLNVCVQVNVSGEASKSGVIPGEVWPLVQQLASMPSIRLRGLMTIIENTRDEVTQRAQFGTLRVLFEGLLTAGLNVDTLSMGMSQDYRVAIEEGATMVRIGSAIFGERV
jgi:PLP dependent protein